MFKFELCVITYVLDTLIFDFKLKTGLKMRQRVY